MSDRLLCERNGVEQWFTRKSWDLLGTNKLGWVEVQVEPPTPREVVPIGRQPIGRSSMLGNGEPMEEVAQATLVEAIPPVSIPGRLAEGKEQQPKTRKPRKK